MGELWDEVKAKRAADNEKRQRGEDLARAKVPPIRGLSAETMAEVEAGNVEIVDDGNAQSQILRNIAEES